MMSLSNRPNENKSNWEPTLLRLTAFPSPSADFTNQKWWSELVGELPEIQNIQPRTGEKVEVGQYRDANLVLNTHPARIDWQYGIDDPSPTITRIPTLGNFYRSLDSFVDLMNRWLGTKDIPGLTRLAFGAILIQPTVTHETAYELLKSYLHFDIKLENTSDFLFQINRRRNTTTDIPSLLVNRLSKWSAMRFQQAQLLPVQQIGQSFYAARLELDINTAVEFEEELPSSKLSEIFQELSELGEEISVKGDIP